MQRVTRLSVIWKKFPMFLPTQEKFPPPTLALRKIPGEQLCSSKNYGNTRIYGLYMTSPKAWLCKLRSICPKFWYGLTDHTMCLCTRGNFTIKFLNKLMQTNPPDQVIPYEIRTGTATATWNDASFTFFSFTGCENVFSKLNFCGLTDEIQRVRPDIYSPPQRFPVSLKGRNGRGLIS